MPQNSITSAFNDGYIAELYEQWLRDPASVDSSWREYFAMAQRLGGGAAPAAAGSGAPATFCIVSTLGAAPPAAAGAAPPPSRCAIAKYSRHDESTDAGSRSHCSYNSAM